MVDLLLNTNIKLFILSTLVLLISQIFAVLRWQFILNEMKIFHKLIDVTSVTFQANFLLNISPVGIFLGDGYKLLRIREIKNSGVADLAFSIFFDRLNGAIASAFLAFLCVPVILYLEVFIENEPLSFVATGKGFDFSGNFYLLFIFYSISIFVFLFLPYLFGKIGKFFQLQSYLPFIYRSKFELYFDILMANLFFKNLSFFITVPIDNRGSILANVSCDLGLYQFPNLLFFNVCYYFSFKPTNIYWWIWWKRS